MPTNFNILSSVTGVLVCYCKWSLIYIWSVQLKTHNEKKYPCATNMYHIKFKVSLCLANSGAHTYSKQTYLIRCVVSCLSRWAAPVHIIQCSNHSLCSQPFMPSNQTTLRQCLKGKKRSCYIIMWPLKYPLTSLLKGYYQTKYFFQLGRT